ncbi:ABC transporter ATP-binding protein [Prosthecomicrobium hirschii]|uniref:ABC transporter ATP-binding protein n=1 Tax=Prosthecodimorpha hirschii TaxID=665126 RepID=UPI00112D6E51|nr:ABC transporter ATP-binding protein [Prosthecomicrobium hirschii]TPQ46226.1 ABC transporter ATP-binding protein [Prosthecomicrobium hirschii]
MTSVTFAGVRKTYGDTVALAGLDLAIEPGEFVALLGPSGSGKTTTLNLLAGLIDADDGEIRIGGRVVNDVTPDRRDIAMVFQNYALYPHLTVFENLEFPLRARDRRVAATVVEAKVDRVAGTLGLGDLLHRYPKELSGGQQQRVALGRAMIREPKVFLLDEPLSNLDARLRIRMRRDIKALHEAIGSTIVYVTHDQAEAMTLATRIAVFAEGRLQQFASPAEIYARPANLFVAGFLGEREPVLMAGRIETGDGLAFVAPDGRLALDAAAARHLAPFAGRPVVLCIRAEALRPSRGTDGADGAVVAQVELSGPDAILYCRLDGGAEVVARADPADGFAKGDRIGLTADAARLTAFDPTTGAALRAGE